MTPQELKASILQLAIQGKLVEQRPEEGTGAELLEKILAAKGAGSGKRGTGNGKSSRAEARRRGEGSSALTSKNNTAHSAAPREEIPDSEKPFDIPESWVWMRIADCCIDVFSGKSPVYVKSENPYRIVGQAANQQQGLDFSQIKYTTKDFWAGMSSRYFLRENDVLLNTLGNGTLGRSGIVGKLPFQLLTDGHLFVFRLKDKTQSQFFYYYLQLRRDEIEKNANGSTNQTFLSLGKTLQWLIPLPPLAEQKRIVAKIEELLPYIDRYEKAWSKLEDFNKRFPGDMQKSLLQMAIQGKLVDQCLEEGTGEELYHQIQSEKQRLIKSGKIKKEKPLPEITPDEIPFDIPESWKWCRITDCGVFIAGYTPKSTDLFKSGMIPYFKVAHMNYPGNELFLTHTDSYIKNPSLKSFLKGTIVYPKNGGAVFTNKKRILAQDSVVDLNTGGYYPIAPVDVKFAYIFISNIDFRKCYKGTALPTIDMDKLKSKLFPLPPLAEQKRIVAKLEELLPLCERLK